MVWQLTVHVHKLHPVCFPLQIASFFLFQMGGLECVITGLMDEFESQFKRFKIKREAFTGFIVFFSFFVAMCCVTPVWVSVFPSSMVSI